MSLIPVVGKSAKKQLVAVAKEIEAIEARIAYEKAQFDIFSQDQNERR
jgi:hypothetical protein